MSFVLFFISFAISGYYLKISIYNKPRPHLMFNTSIRDFQLLRLPVTYSLLTVFRKQGELLSVC